MRRRRLHAGCARAGSSAGSCSGGSADPPGSSPSASSPPRSPPAPAETLLTAARLTEKMSPAVGKQSEGGEGNTKSQWSYDVVQGFTYPKNAGNVFPGSMNHVGREDGADGEIFVSGIKEEQVSCYKSSKAFQGLTRVSVLVLTE